MNVKVYDFNNLTTPILSDISDCRTVVMLGKTQKPEFRYSASSTQIVIPKTSEIVYMQFDPEHLTVIVNPKEEHNHD